MEIPIYQVDAFTNQVFGGNPAAVCPLEQWLPDTVLQSIAAENNLSETAFYVPEGDAYRLRWFTPTVEVDLAGHPTLAAASVIYNELPYLDRIEFVTQIGDHLHVSRDGDTIWIELPARPPIAAESTPEIWQLFGETLFYGRNRRDLFVVLESETRVRDFIPDFTLIKMIADFGLIVTAQGEECDFVSRFFAPGAGVDEDPVTGSAHTALTPYWSSLLEKTELLARQISKRGGELICRQLENRVALGGQTVFYMKGRITIP